MVSHQTFRVAWSCTPCCTFVMTAITEGGGVALTSMTTLHIARQSSHCTQTKMEKNIWPANLWRWSLSYKQIPFVISLMHRKLDTKSCSQFHSAILRFKEPYAAHRQNMHVVFHWNYGPILPSLFWWTASRFFPCLLKHLGNDKEFVVCFSLAFLGLPMVVVLPKTAYQYLVSVGSSLVYGLR